MDIAAVGDIAQLIVAGMAGGVLRSVYFKEPWRKYIESIIVGGAVAYYLGPVAPQVFSAFFPLSATVGEYRELSGFLVGAGGVGIVGWIIDVWAGWSRRLVRRDGRHDQDDSDCDG